MSLTPFAQPTAIIAFCTFIPAYVQRYGENDTAYWLLFILFFIIDTVGCVMNAYNNITWVSFPSFSPSPYFRAQC